MMLSLTRWDVVVDGEAWLAAVSLPVSRFDLRHDLLLRLKVRSSPNGPSEAEDLGAGEAGEDAIGAGVGTSASRAQVAISSPAATPPAEPAATPPADRLR
jgi:hypothetical protein